MTKQLNIWQSQFGVDWTNRTNISPNDRRLAFWKMLPHWGYSILEVGCNKGYNLITISELGGYELLVGIDPLSYAVKSAVKESKPYNISYLLGECCHLPFADNSFDLVFTAGVLMHVTSENLSGAISELCRVSRGYILTIEYFSEVEESLYYRGYDDLLWQRDYELYFPWLCKRIGYWTVGYGFDGCHWWLFEK